MPGMLTSSGIRVFRVDDDGYVLGYGDHRYPVVREVTGSDVPIFTDPATLGCLLALVREVYGDPSLVSGYRPHGGWQCVGPITGWRKAGDTEAETLVAALEAAP